MRGTVKRYYLSILCSSIGKSKIKSGDAMEERRKCVILFAETLMCVRKLMASMELDKPNLAKPYFVDRAVRKPEFILEKIDKQWPAAE